MEATDTIILLIDDTAVIGMVISSPNISIVPPDVETMTGARWKTIVSRTSVHMEMAAFVMFLAKSGVVFRGTALGCRFKAMSMNRLMP